MGIRNRWTTESVLAWLAENHPHFQVDNGWEYGTASAQIPGGCTLHHSRVSPTFKSLKYGDHSLGYCCAGGTIWTTESVLAWLAEHHPHFQVDNGWEYRSAKSPISGTCTLHDRRVSPTFNNLKYGDHRSLGYCCAGKTIWTTESVLAWLAEHHPHFAVDNNWEYKTNSTPISGTCTLHGTRVGPNLGGLVDSGRRIGVCCAGGTKWTTESVLAWLAEHHPHFQVDDGWEYRNVNSPIPGKCTLHDSTPAPHLSSLLRGSQVGYCCAGGTIWTTESVLGWLQENWPDFRVDDGWEYRDNLTPIPGECTLHNSRVSPTLGNLTRGHSLGYCCAGGTIWTTESVLGWLQENWPDFRVDDGWEYENVDQPIPGECTLHHSQVSPTFFNLRIGQGLGCDICKPPAQWGALASKVENLSREQALELIDGKRYLYVVQVDDEAVKIGIGSKLRSKVFIHEEVGWLQYESKNGWVCLAEALIHTSGLPQPPEERRMAAVGSAGGQTEVYLTDRNYWIVAGGLLFWLVEEFPSPGDIYDLAIRYRQGEDVLGNLRAAAQELSLFRPGGPE